MAINAYTGLMGSGKSYEVVSSVIVPAINQGRRVVTNIEGIDGDAIRAFCIDRLKAEPSQLGEVVAVSNDQVHQSDFLPHGTTAVTVCQPGDLICIDEAWRFWGTEAKPCNEHKIFFREHRHYIHPESGVSCDLALMVQDISDLHRTLKVVVELTTRTVKLKKLGMNRAYRVELYEGYRLNKKTRFKVINKRYDPAVFPLYSSYSGGQGKEQAIDKRQNVFASPLLWLFVVGTLGMFALSAYFLVGFFRPVDSEAMANTVTIPEVTAAPAVATPPAPVTPAPPATSSTWRVAGRIQQPGRALVILVDQAGQLRLEPASQFYHQGLLTVGDVDGQRVTVFSGSRTLAAKSKEMTP
ncbi:hypothetical protein LL240_17215 [Oceanimonas baumannii]|uniref:zonular occludens toxin domain-containing protein n=1 Tax=Oceanimonas baumannii TaxID=129578 RepID=UPI001D1934CF|nr:zonular occludens toxin domain-containing protein [Oceanimonas baumannii]MCC4266176.1 hypothetical protein [Oceanimonas baumannii]